jgi:hypothetical protein
VSVTFSIACRECKVHLWIGQSHSSGAHSGHLYTAESHTKALWTFLAGHQGHALVFDENCESEIADFREVEPDESSNS